NGGMDQAAAPSPCVVSLPTPVQVVHQSAMVDHHALWLAGRARGVDDISEVTGSDTAARVDAALLRNGAPVGIQIYLPDGLDGYVLCQILMGQQDRHLGILDHKVQALLRQAHVEGD